MLVEESIQKLCIKVTENINLGWFTNTDTKLKKLGYFLYVVAVDILPCMTSYWEIKLLILCLMIFGYLCNLLMVPNADTDVK